MSRSLSKITWVVGGGRENELGHCTRCGEGCEIKLPARMDFIAGAMKEFVKAHRNCRDVGYKEPTPTTPQEWRAGRDTGISSCTIYAVMTNTFLNAAGTPHDAADFGRCHRLLKLFPEWRSRLPQVSARFSKWTPIVADWKRLESLYEAGEYESVATILSGHERRKS